MKVFAVVPARMGSERLPGKSMAMLCGKPAFEHICERLSRSRYLGGVVLATTVKPEDEPLRYCARLLGIPCFSGSPEDVLGRTLAAARSANVDVIVQITGDCPLIDPFVSDRVIEAYLTEKPDYATSMNYPIGMGAEVFATSVLAEVDALTRDPADREHVSLVIYEHPEKYRLVNVMASPLHDRPNLRLCIDTQEDYQVVSAIYAALYPVKPDFGLDDILAFLDKNPQIASINSKVGQKRARE